jgi:hypothetical protein
MTNPALIELMAQDRTMELRTAAANRSWRSWRSAVPVEIAARRTTSRPRRQVRPANPQRAIGWFLVSVGLRLALPRTPTGSAR